MITTFVVLVVAVGAIWYYVEKNKKDLDVNKDGKLDAADVKAAAEEVKAEVKEKVEEVKAEVAVVKAVVAAKKPGRKKKNNG